MANKQRVSLTLDKATIKHIDIIAEKTIDEKIVSALRKKINIASQVMGEELKDWI